MSALGDAVAKLIAAGTRLTAQTNVFSQILSADKNTDVDDGAGGSLPSMRKLQDEIAPQLLEAEQVAVTAKNTAVAAKDTASEVSIIAVAAKDEAVQSATGATASELVAAAAELYVRGVAVVNGFVDDLLMNGKKIVNLADGVDDGDGVNVGQLNGVNDNAETKLAKDQNLLDVADANTAMQNLMPDGYVPQPGMQSFLAVNDSIEDTLVIDDAAVFSNIKQNNTNGQYDPATGRFTADRDLLLLVNAQFFVGLPSTGSPYGRFRIVVNGAQYGPTTHSPQGVEGYTNLSTGLPVLLLEDDYVELVLFGGGGGYLWAGNYSSFAAAVIG